MLFVAPLALWGALMDPPSAPVQPYSTAVGEIARHLLGPYIAVSLNTATQLEAALNPKSCDITLKDGEALFEVDARETRRLRILAGSTVVTGGPGVRFTVRVRDAEHVDVMVGAGAVTLTPRSDAGFGGGRAGGSGSSSFQTTVVAANLMALVSPSGVELESFDPQKFARRIEWTDGYLHFSGETLKEATEEFNRYNVQQFVIDDEALQTVHIGGRFRSSDTRRFVAALSTIHVAVVEPKRAGASSNDVIRLIPPHTGAP